MAVIKKRYKIALLLSLLGAIFFIYFSFNPTKHSFFLPCPFRYATGYLCPGCGSQRAFHQLLHGNLLQAFRLNPLLMLTLPILLYGIGLVAYNFIFGTNYRFKLLYNNTFLYTYFIIVLIYWITRNIAVAPFTYLQGEI